MFKALRFGPLQMEMPVFQAALSGYSDAPMRRIARKFGAEFTLCEVMLDKFVVEVSARKSKRYFADFDEHPVGAQLMGNEPEQFVRAAQRLVNEGFDLIDLNFACPVRKVLGRGRGGYLMSDPETALNIVRNVREELPERIPLTVKLRKGFDDSPESRRNFFTILDGCVQYGVCAFTVHGRTVKQRYEGTSDWEFIREVKQYLLAKRQNIPLSGSGDLFTADVCVKRLQESGADGLALARGVIGNPWLFRDVKALMNDPQAVLLPPTLEEQREVIAEHFHLSVELYGERRASTTMRAFGVKYALLHPRYEEVRQAFARTKTAADWNDVLKTFYR